MYQINSVLKNLKSYLIYTFHENPDTFSSYYEKLKISPKINEISCTNLKTLTIFSKY